MNEKGPARVERNPLARWPVRGWVGLLLIATCWPLNWTVKGITAYLFAPLWLGYVLVVDSVVAWRTGTSIWSRSRKEFVLLFVASAPVWWIFELINHRTRNWEYLGSEHFSTFEYYLLCTISFSTVMPAVFETAELVASFGWVQRTRCARTASRPGSQHLTNAMGRGSGPKPPALPIRLISNMRTLRRAGTARGPLVDATTPPRLLKPGRWEATFFVIGAVMLSLTLLWPRYFYPFVWTSLLLLLEPVNRWLGREHFMEYLQAGDWRPVISLSVGALICGFFWEMWNFYSWPKWIYHTPGAQYLHIFEMPLLGYLGYVPFGLELFALRNLVWKRAPRMNFKTAQ